MGWTSPIPVIDLSEESMLVEGTETWEEACAKIREAGEQYGCFQMVFHGGDGRGWPVAGKGSTEEWVGAMVDAFGLPDEAKRRNASKKPYFGYQEPCETVPLYESLGVEDADHRRGAETFTRLLWPEGNRPFCDILNSIGEGMWKLENLIRRMIFSSYGLGVQAEDHIAESQCVLRLNKYTAPGPGLVDSALGLVPHTDKSMLTILGQHEVEGLEVQPKGGGEWVVLPVLPSALVVIVGDVLRAWSNGRLHAARHRVMMSGERLRFSFAVFSIPKEGAMVKVSELLVDDDHPLAFKTFDYSEYTEYFRTEAQHSEVALEMFAGLQHER